MAFQTYNGTNATQRNSTFKQSKALYERPFKPVTNALLEKSWPCAQERLSQYY